MSWAGGSADGLRGVPRSSRPSDGSRPALILLPGILGSHLAVDGERVWLSLRILGGLDRLAYQDGQANIRADGAIGSVYDDLAAYLADSHEVTVFAFDWRRPIEEEAIRLAEVIDQAVSKRTASRQPVRLLAHSMGGLVARTVQLERPKVWQRWLEHPDARLLMLGTPNGGSYAPMQVLSGDDSMGNALAGFGLPFQDHKARSIMAAMPGFLQLQAGLTDRALNLAQSARWQALADQDMEALRQANWWHDPSNQRAVYQWGVPPQSVLDKAVALRERLDKQAAESLAGFKDRVVMVVGHARFTPAGFELSDREGLVYLDRPEGGDGRVTLDSALLPGVRTWRVDAPHGSLPDVEKAFKAYQELLEKGQTTLLSELLATRGAGPSGKAELPTTRSRPSRQAGLAQAPLVETSELFGQADTGSEAFAPRHSALRVSVHNGNLKFISVPLMVGHYVSSKLTGSERVVDRFTGGVMSASLAAGLYPEAPGVHQIFVNHEQDPGNPLALPRPPHVVVAGLGEEGKLRSASLTHTVRQATLAWAQRVGETAGAAQFELAATLIGSGGSGITVFAAAQAVAQGVREANEKLAQGNWPQVSHLRLVELYLDRATEAWNALRLLASASSEHFVLDERIHPLFGAMRRPLDSGYRGTPYDFVSAIAEKDENGETHILYALDSQRARADVRAQGTQAQLVVELVKRASNDAHTGGDIGRTLFQLLVPVELEASLAGTSELLLELNDGTAAIPWEMLDTPDDGRSKQRPPWAIRNKLLRRLRTAEFRTQISDARPEDAVLVIGEPLCNTRDAQGREVYPRLPGARQEAQRVNELLVHALGEQNVKALIATDDAPGQDAVAVTTALLARRYRIVHIAGHGEPELERPPLPPQPRGVVLSDGTFLGPREVEAMRVVPELVFLNCCHLAADARQLLRPRYDRASFAAGVAKQLIRIGVRCVIAAGWAVEDDAANQFATAFYRELLAGQRFMDAVQAGRVAAYNANPRGNTWAAYQCYGDPDWVLRPAPDSGKRELDLTHTYQGVASPVDLTLALETLTVQSHSRDQPPEIQHQHLRHLETRFGEAWGGMGAVAESFGLAWAAAEDLDNALPWLQRAVSANDGSAGVKAGEQLANLSARRAWERVSSARRAGRPLAASIKQGREDIQGALRTLDALAQMAPTLERESLLGSAWKRLAQLEGQAGQPAAQRKAIENMVAHYERAEVLAQQGGQLELFYPGLNLLCAEWVLKGRERGWAGFDAQRLLRVRQCLERKHRDDPDFWSVVGPAELSLYEGLVQQTLDAQMPGILKVLAGLRERIGTALLWASVADHWTFALGDLPTGSSRQARAARELLSTLEAWAGAT
jgi:CHAT domain-containing protein